MNWSKPSNQDLYIGARSPSFELFIQSWGIFGWRWSQFVSHIVEGSFVRGDQKSAKRRIASVWEEYSRFGPRHWFNIECPLGHQEQFIPSFSPESYHLYLFLKFRPWWWKRLRGICQIVKLYWPRGTSTSKRLKSWHSWLMIWRTPSGLIQNCPN